MSVVRNKVRKVKKTEAIVSPVTLDQSQVERLIEKATDGNFEAFGEIYNIYLDRIYRYVFYQVNDRMTAEDITEEAFIKAWKAIGSCKGREKTFSSWLYRIAHNQLIDTLRYMKKCTSLESENIIKVIDFQQEIEKKTEREELIEAMTCLPRNQKQVIILKFIEGLDNREIGKIMGKNEGAIRVSQMRALATLRQKMGKEKGGNEK